MLRTFVTDCRLALRGVRRARAFYAAAILTLAIGLAGAVVMFTLIRGILLRPLPIPDQDRLVVSWRVPPTGLATHVPYRASDVEILDRESQSFAAVTGVGYNGAVEQTWADGGRILSARTAVVMGEFFHVAGVTPLLGQALDRDHDRRGAEKALVLSYGAWQRLFGGSPDVVGRSLVARNHAFTIAGVMPADFEYPRGVEIWTTLTAQADGVSNPAFRAGLLRDVELVARLRPGVTVDQAASELAAMIPRLDAAHTAPSFANFRPVVRAYKDVVVGDIDAALVVLFAAVGLILAIAVANVANLLLMRGETRRSELVVRAALGASRGRLVGELIAESLVVALLAGVVGFALSHWSLQTVTTLVPGGLPRLAAIRTDALVMAFTAGLALVAAVVAGVVPALAASRIDLVAQLRAGGRGTAGAASARGRRLLVAAQVALAVTVVAAAGLLGRSLQRLQTADTGLAADVLVFAELDLPRDRDSDEAQRDDGYRTFHDEVVARIAAAPGIEAVTPLNVQPFAGATGWDLPRFTAEGQTADQVAMNPALNLEAVYLPYFSTLGVAIQRGRAFTTADRDGAPRVAIVSDAMAAATWPGQDPIGKRLKFGGIDATNEWLTVVGVAGTTRYRELATPRPTLYIPTEQFMMSGGRLAIRSAAGPALVAGVVGDAVRAVNPAVRVTRIASYAEYLRVPLAWPRFTTLLLAVFATAALLLSSIGLYGVMAASVRQRYAEIGVRVALGATAADVRRLVLGEGLRLAVVGAVAGLALAVAVTRVLRGLLFETEPLEPATLLAAAAVLVGAALLASYVPARRATRIDPVEALRAE
jgi:putative ABC transport system permease protein